MSSKSTRQPVYLGSRFSTSDTMFMSQTATYSASAYSMSTTWGAQFMGYAPFTFSAAVVKFYLSTRHNWTTAYSGSYIEMGLYTGDYIMGSSARLYRFDSRSISAYVSATASPAATVGIKRVVLGGNTRTGGDPSTVLAGTPVWIMYGYYAGTGGTGAVTPQLLSAGNRDIGTSSRLCNSNLSFAAATSTMSGNLGRYVWVQPVAQTVAPSCLSITYYQDQTLDIPIEP